MNILKKYLPTFKKRQGLLIIVTAAVLLELLSASQYYFTHDILEDELEKRAETELRMKAILIKSTLNSSEDILRNHVYDIRKSLSQPDSIYNVLSQMVMFSRQIRGGSVCFVPNYYPEKGRLYEPYVRSTDEEDSKVEWLQLASETHDYTKRDFYQKVVADGKPLWVDPYEDKEGAQGFITTYSCPVYDSSDRLVAVTGVDISVDWMRDTIDVRHIYKSSFLLLLTEDGRPIIQPSENRVHRETTEKIISMINDSTVARNKSASGHCTVIDFTIDGRDGTVFYANMKGRPHWQLAIVSYNDEVYAPLMRLRVLLLLLSLAAFAVLLFVVWRFANGAKKLEQKTMEQEYINKELKIACDIQQALLPKVEDYKSSTADCKPSPAEQGSDYVKVEGRLIPAKAVGGDLYNAFIRDGKLFFCIGDVTGKGIPAALIMAITQTLFRNIAEHGSNPAHIMGELNRAACRNNKSNIFVTLFIGVLDLPTGRLRYCNAGHEVPILIRQLDNLQFKNLPVQSNLPIGIFEDFNYQLQEMTMEKGDMLFLYTDGLTEAKNAQNKLLGREHMMELAASVGATDPKAMVEGIIAQWRHFVGDTEQSDDMTLLAISYTPVEEQYIFDETLTLKNDVKEVATLSAFIKDVLARLNVGKPLASKLRLALEEAVVNVMEYAYPKGSSGDVNIRVTSDEKRMQFIITDSGISFNPTEALKADTTLTAEERPVGGLGILLVRELMDSINYERIDGKNVLKLMKTITNKR